MIFRLFLPLFLILIISCNSPSKSKNVKNYVQLDTISVYNSMLSHKEINSILSDYPSDSIFVIKNDNLKSLKFLNFPKNKIVTLIGKPRGYPKYGNFDYKRFQISFENLKTQGDTVECGLLIKTIGVFGEFKLKKNDKRFIVTDYNKIMI